MTTATPPSNDAAATVAAADAADAAKTTRRLQIARGLTIAVAVLALVGAVLGAVLLGRVGDTYSSVLEITRDSAKVAADGTKSAEALADGVSQLAISASATLTETNKVIDGAVVSLHGVATALGTNIADAVSGAVTAVSRVAKWVAVVEKFIPGNKPSLAEDLKTFSDGLKPIPDQLKALGVQLDSTADQLTETGKTLAPIADQLVTTAGQIEAAKTDIANAGKVSSDIAVRAQSLLESSHSTIVLSQILVVVLGLVVALAAIAGERALRIVIRRERRHEAVA